MAGRETLRAAFEWDGPGSHYAVNVMHAKRDLDVDWTVTSILDFGQICAATEANPGEGLTAGVNSGWRLAKVVMTTMDESPLGPFEETINIEGQQGGDPPAPNMAMLVRLFTETGGRSGRGRIFLPPCAEGTVDGAGNLTALHAEGVSDGCQALQDALLADAKVLCVYSTVLDVASPIGAFSCQIAAATQRRRLRR